MRGARLTFVLIAIGLVAAGLGLVFGETVLNGAQYVQALTAPMSAPAEIIWAIRAPRVAAAGIVGAALGLAGAVMQGLLRNPLADPGVLGVSAGAGLGAALAIAIGAGAAAGGIEVAALTGALITGLGLTAVAARLRQPESLVLFGAAVSAFCGALTAMVFNLSPSPVTTAEILSWLMGSVANRSWSDISHAVPAMLAGLALCLWSARGLVMLTLGEETAALSGLPMSQLRVSAVAGAALLTGASVAMAGVIGFVGLAAPHLVRSWVGSDPAKALVPSALAGSVILILADLAARVIPTEQELKLGVMTALVGAPVFAVVAWRAARHWRHA